MNQELNTNSLNKFSLPLSLRFHREDSFYSTSSELKTQTIQSYKNSTGELFLGDLYLGDVQLKQDSSSNLFDVTALKQQITVDTLSNAKVAVTLECNPTAINYADCLKLTEQSVITLSHLFTEPLNLVMNNQIIARGRTAVSGENYALYIDMLNESPQPLTHNEFTSVPSTSVKVVIAKTTMNLYNLFSLTTESLLCFDTLLGEPVSINIAGRIFSGEIVVIENNYGVMIKKILSEKNPDEQTHISSDQFEFFAKQLTDSQTQFQNKVLTSLEMNDNSKSSATPIFTDITMSKQYYKLLKHEHPQVVAFTLASSPSNIAAEILANFSLNKQVDLLKRVNALVNVEEIEARRLLAALNRIYNTKYAINHVAVSGNNAFQEIINTFDNLSKQKILDELNKM